MRCDLGHGQFDIVGYVVIVDDHANVKTWVEAAPVSAVPADEVEHISKCVECIHTGKFKEGLKPENI